MEEILEVVKRLSADSQSKFFLKDVGDVNKPHVQNTLRRSPYPLDREVDDVVKTFGDKIVESIVNRPFRNILPRVPLSTKLFRYSVCGIG